MKGSATLGARRRLAVAALAAVLALSVVSVVTASARPTRVRDARATRQLEAVRQPGGRPCGPAGPGRAAGAGGARSEPGQSGRGDRRPANGHAPDGRQARRVPHEHERPAGRAGRHELRRRPPAGVRAEPGRPADVPSPAGLRRHRGHPSHLLDAAGGRRHRLPERTEGERDERRPSDQRHRLHRCTGSASRSIAPAAGLDRGDRHRSAFRRGAGPRRAADGHGEAGALLHTARGEGLLGDHHVGEPELPGALGRRRADRRRLVAREPDPCRRRRHRPGRRHVPERRPAQRRR